MEYFSGFAATKRLDHDTIINNLFTIVKRKNNKDLYKGLRFLLSVAQMHSNLYPPFFQSPFVLSRRSKLFKNKDSTPELHNTFEISELHINKGTLYVFRMGRGDFSRPDFGRLKPPLPQTNAPKTCFITFAKLNSSFLWSNNSNQPAL